MIVWVAGALAQQIYTSEPTELVFQDELELFNFLSFDTGYIPSISDPLSVRFHVTPTGGVVTEMEAVSNLEWPLAFKHSLESIAGEGVFGIDTHVDVEFEVHIDVAGVLQASIPVWTEDFDIVRAISFDTLVLPGSFENPLEIVVTDQALFDPFEYSIDVVPGVAALQLEVVLFPELEASLAGNRIETTLGSSLGTQDGEGGFGLLDPPIGNPGEVFLQSTYFADLTSAFTLIIQPTASLDTLLGDFDLVNIPIPVELLSLAETWAFDPVTYTHPLPALALPDEAYDFGEVPITTLHNLEMPLTNIGVLGLEGTAHIEGGDAFSVYPDTFYATEGTTDGVVVSFQPLEVGSELATLVLISNDPVVPELRIALSGAGFDPTPPPLVEETPPPEPPPPSNLSGEDVKGCGCESGALPLSVLWVLPLILGRRAR